MSILEYTLICIVALGIVSILLYYLIKGIRNGWFDKILSTVQTAIKEAEEKYQESGKGIEKKQYVMSKVSSKCEELGIPFKLLYKLISNFIDTVIQNYNMIKK